MEQRSCSASESLTTTISSGNDEAHPEVVGGWSNLHQDGCNPDILRNFALQICAVANHKFRQYHSLALLIGDVNSPSINLNVIASKTQFAAAVPNPETEEIHVERTS